MINIKQRRGRGWWLFLWLLCGFLQAANAENVNETNDSPEILPVDTAFQFTSFRSESQVTLNWKIAPEHYLYRDRIAIRAEGTKIKVPELPPGKEKQDTFFGISRVFYHQLEVRLSIQKDAPSLRLHVTYQGCARGDSCYLPITKVIEFAAQNKPGKVIVSKTGFSPFSQENNAQVSPFEDAFPAQDYVSEEQKLIQKLKAYNLGWTLLIFFGLGIGLSFMPCFFPMLPILASILAGQGNQLNTQRAFLLSLTYTQSMAITFALFGIIIAWAGYGLQGFFQSPAVVITLASLYVLLAFAMFGLYNLRIPSWWETKLIAYSNLQQGGTYVGVAIMGVLAALIVAPCVTAPLIAILLYIAQTGDRLIGGASLYSLALGMGLPLLLVGTSFGKWLPRAGEWMNTVKAIFGVLLIAVALYLIGHLLPKSVVLFLWAILLIICAVYLGAFNPAERAFSKLSKGLGLVIFVYGILLMLGGAIGKENVRIFSPLEFLVTTPPTPLLSQPHKLSFKQIKSVNDLTREIEHAKAQGSPIMLDFYAKWCIACEEFAAFTFPDETVRDALKGVILLQANVTANDPLDLELLRKLHILGLPAILFFDSKGNELTTYRVNGFVPPKKFTQHVKHVFRK